MYLVFTPMIVSTPFSSLSFTDFSKEDALLVEFVYLIIIYSHAR